MAAPPAPYPLPPALAHHSALLLGSHRHFTGKELIPMNGSPTELAQGLFDAAFVLLSHGTETDPILNYGNRAALELWEMSWEEFVKTPSRLTAEPMEQAGRAGLLAEAARRGWIGGYRGVRRSKSGRRFLIEDAVLWNLVDARGRYRGQAAKFEHWSYL